MRDGVLPEAAEQGTPGPEVLQHHLLPRLLGGSGFDRWVANPEGMALPQCYDEFLDREELACVVEGCDWKGKSLTLHMNQAHGVRADEFKRAAGFNLSTGVIAKPLAESLREEEKSSGSRLIWMTPTAPLRLHLHKKRLRRTISATDRWRGGSTPKKSTGNAWAWAATNLRWLRKAFQQSTPMGKALYCSRECRDNAYAEQRRANASGVSGSKTARSNGCCLTP